MYTLIQNSETIPSPITGAPLTGAAEGSSTTVNGVTCYYTYAGGNGQSFTLTAASPANFSVGAGIYTLEQVKSGSIDNIELLQGTTVLDSLPADSIVGPITKTLACGDTGIGAMAEVADVVAAVQVMLSRAQAA